MGRLFLREFDRSFGDYYVCRICDTPIALLVDLCAYTDENGGHIFSEAINVHTYSPEEDRRVNNRTITDLYCNKCCFLVGFKFIEVAADEKTPRVDDFMINLDKLRRISVEDDEDSPEE